MTYQKTKRHLVEAAIDKYRAARKAETGKMITRTVAVREIILAHCAGIKPPAELSDRVRKLEEAVEDLRRNEMQRMALGMKP